MKPSYAEENRRDCEPYEDDGMMRDEDEEDEDKDAEDEDTKPSYKAEDEDAQCRG